MIAKLIKGKGFRGALEYDLRQEKGYMLATNMAGDTPRSLAREFGQVRTLRPNLSRAVCHVSLALAPGESLSDKQWQGIAEKYLEHKGFTDNQFVATRHTEAAHQHMHLIINRIALSGEVVSDSNDYKRQEVLMRQLEQEYNLSRVASSKESSRKALSKGEVEHALRTGESSVRVRLQALVSKAVAVTKRFGAFTAFLAAQGVEVRVNQASTGRISGISFCLDSVALKGSDLGKAYTWNALQKQGISHEQTRSSEEYEHGRTGPRLLPAGDKLSGCGTAQGQPGQCERPASGLVGQEHGADQSLQGTTNRHQERGNSGQGFREQRKGVSR